jgi:hypothetical protein
VLGSAASKHPLAMIHNGFLSLYTSSNAESKFNKTSARDQVVNYLLKQLAMCLYVRSNTSSSKLGIFAAGV